jgi:cold shock CspA family protein
MMPCDHAQLTDSEPARTTRIEEISCWQTVGLLCEERQPHSIGIVRYYYPGLVPKTMQSHSAAPGNSAESAPHSQNSRTRSHRRRGGGEDQTLFSKARHAAVASAAPSCRITIYNGVMGFNAGAGKLLVVPDSWDEFISLCAIKFSVSPDRIRGIQMPPPDSASIDQISDMLNGDKIIVVVDQSSATQSAVVLEAGGLPLASRMPAKTVKMSASSFNQDSIDTDSLVTQELELMRIIEGSPAKSFGSRVATPADVTAKHAKALASFNGYGSSISDVNFESEATRTGSAAAISSLVGHDSRTRDLHSPTSSVPIIQPSSSGTSTFHQSHLPPEGSLLWRVTKQPNLLDQSLSFLEPSSGAQYGVSDSAGIAPTVRYGMILTIPGVGGTGGHVRTHVCGQIEDIPFSRFDVSSNHTVRVGDFVSFETQFRPGPTSELAVHAVNILPLPGNFHEMIAAFGGGVTGSADAFPSFLHQQQMLQQQQLPQSNVANKKSRQQAHFSVLVRVLRDNLVQSGSKDMRLNLLVNRLAEVCPDWKTRLECQNLFQYVAEAHACGLVECLESNDSNCIVRLNGERSIGVVKWVKDSYGFIQSPFHTEDLFYHASEHSNDLGVTIPLSSGQEVEFLIVKNALTGKLNATQIHLLVRSDPRLADLRVSILKENMPRSQSHPSPHPTPTTLFPHLVLPQAPGVKLPFRGSTFSVAGPLKSQHANGAGSISETESNKEPGLHKTKLCKFFPYCPRGAHCWFAHGPHELRMHAETNRSSMESENVLSQVGGDDIQSHSMGSSSLFLIGSDIPSTHSVSSWSNVSGLSVTGTASSIPFQPQSHLSSHHVPAHHPSVGAVSSDFSQDTSSSQTGNAGWVAE